MDPFKIVDDKLKELNIQYQIVEHEPAVTIELADAFIEGIEGVRTKTLFLTNKKKTSFYLIVTEDKKRVDINKFKEMVAEKHIKIASEATLFEKMQLSPGIVSPFGLLYNSDKDIKVYFDEDIINEDRMSFHPNNNEKTIFVNTDDIIRYIKSIGYEVNITKI